MRQYLQLFLTIVFAGLLSSLYLLSFVNMHLRNTSITRRNDLPKLEIAMLYTSAGLPSRFVVLICRSILLID